MQKTPLLPERAETTFGLAETQTVVYKPVSESVIPEPTWDDGPGGISLPHPRSTVSWLLLCSYAQVDAGVLSSINKPG